MLSYSAHNSKTILVKGDKKKFASLLKQVEGRWNTKQDGWLIPIDNEKKLKNLMNALYPENVAKEEVVTTEVKSEDPQKVKSEQASAFATGGDDESSSKRSNEEDSRRYRRSRSPPSSPSSSSSSSDDQSPPRRAKSNNKIDKYYQSFKKSPRSFNSNLFDDDHIHLSSSSSSGDESSSPDFPNPSPKRGRHVTDEVFDKMENVRRRLRQMEMEEKDRKRR